MSRERRQKKINEENVYTPYGVPVGLLPHHANGGEEEMNLRNEDPKVIAGAIEELRANFTGCNMSRQIYRLERAYKRATGRYYFQDRDMYEREYMEKEREEIVQETGFGD